MMASSQQTNTNKKSTDDAKYIDVDELSIDDDLLGDVHLAFGQEDEDSVFDQSLLQYLDQLPIAPPPPEAKYSPAFVESVLKDIQCFKEENDNIFADNKGPVSRHAFVNHDEFSVEQPRYYQGQEINDEEGEAPIRVADMDEQGFKSVCSNQPSLGFSADTSFSNDQQKYKFPLAKGLQFVYTDQSLSDDSAKYSDSVVFLDDPQQEDPLPDDELYIALFEDESKDFSSWLCFDDEDEDEEVRFKDDVDLYTSSEKESAVETNNEYTHSPEYPLPPKYLLKQTNLKERDDITTHSAHVDTSHDNQNIKEVPVQMGVTVNQRLEDNHLNTIEAHPSEQNLNSKALSSSPQQQQEQERYHETASLRKEGRNKPVSTVRISKAGIMSTNSPSLSTTIQKWQPTLNNNEDDKNNNENSASDISFSELLVDTSTTTEKNKRRSIPSKSRVLSKVDNQQETSSSLRFNTRSGSRNSNRIDKAQNADTVPKRTFNLRRKC